MSTSAPHTLLEDSYELLRPLGSGGMGAVFLASHRRTGGPVAIKLLRAELASQEQSLRRFREEARILSALHHPNLVQVFDVGQDAQGRPFLAMEYLTGETLAQRLDAHGSLRLVQWLPLLAQIGSALQAAHQAGVIHRDVKPANLLLSEHVSVAGKQQVVKVLDFGIAKVRQMTSQLTGEAEILGTPHYLAPEVAEGKSARVDATVDQWALAVVTYRVLSGRLPFDRAGLPALLCQILTEEPEPLGRLVPELPACVTAAVARALSKDPARRFPSVVDFVAACGTAPPVRPTRRDARMRLLMAGFAGAGVTAIIAVGLSRTRPQTPVTSGPSPSAMLHPSPRAPAPLTVQTPPVTESPKSASAAAPATPANEADSPRRSSPRPETPGARPRPRRTAAPLLFKMPWHL